METAGWRPSSPGTGRTTVRVMASRCSIGPRMDVRQCWNDFANGPNGPLGVTLGPDERPRGWTTVCRDSPQLRPHTRTSEPMRIVTATEAVAGVRSGDSIYVHGAGATPSVLLDALVCRAQELRDVRMVHLHIEGPGPHLRPEMAGHFRHTALFIGPNARAAVNEGRADYIPTFLSDVPGLFRNHVIPLDTVLINVSPPDEHG